MMHEWMELQPYVAKGLCAVEGGLYLQGLVKIEGSVADRIILVRTLQLLFYILTHKFFLGIEVPSLSMGNLLCFLSLVSTEQNFGSGNIKFIKISVTQMFCNMG